MSENKEQKTNEEVTVAQEEIATPETKESEAYGNTEINEKKVEKATDEVTNNVKKKTKKPLIIAISCVLAIAVIVGIILLVVINSKSAEAKRVDDLISSIGTVTLDSEQKITEAEKEVKKLSKEDYKQLDNTENLKQARVTFESIKAKKLIEEIGPVTLDSESKIKAARNAYDAASEKARKMVKNYDKLTEAENTLSSLQATKVEILINDIGTVNENSEDKIKKAEDAYNALSSDAQQKVTNYSKLTEARKKLPSVKKAALKKKMYNALSKLKKTTDNVRNITWYESPNKPEETKDGKKQKTYLLPYIAVSGSLDDSAPDASLCLFANYFGSVKTSFDTLYINVDGKAYTKNFNSSAEYDDHWPFLSKYREYSNEETYKSDREWLNAIANGKKAVIRFSGTNSSEDFVLTDSDKQDIKEVLEAYDLIEEYTLSDVKYIMDKYDNG